MPDQQGAFADAARARETDLIQRLGTSVRLDRSFEEILRGAHRYNVQSRQQLDALEAEIRQTAAAWPGLDTPAGARQFQAYLTGKTREIHAGGTMRMTRWLKRRASFSRPLWLWEWSAVTTQVDGSTQNLGVITGIDEGRLWVIVDLIGPFLTRQNAELVLDR